MRDNFRRLLEHLRSDPVMSCAFEFYEWDLAAGSYPATLTVTHRLGYVPRDVVVTSTIGGTATFNMDQFTRTTVSVTVSAATVVRAFLGTHGEGRVS